jgi:hypothetical protein
MTLRDARFLGLIATALALGRMPAQAQPAMPTPTQPGCHSVTLATTSVAFQDRGSTCIDVEAPNCCCWETDGGGLVTSPRVQCGPGRVCVAINCDCLGCYDVLEVRVGGKVLTVECLNVTPTSTPATPPETATATPTSSDVLTPLPTVTPAPTRTRTPTPAASATSTPPWCVGDCNGHKQVTIYELLTLVNIALGNAGPSACINGVPTGAAIDTELLVEAVANALHDYGAD